MVSLLQNVLKIVSITSCSSHYIAIPHSEKRHRKRIKRKTEEVIILQNRNEIQTKSASTLTEDVLFSHGVINEMEGVSCLLQSSECNITTRKELFETEYTKTEGKRKSERKEQISGLLMPYFNDEEEAENYVEQNLERKRRNLISRRIRMTRKANLQEFNYFCTFTYDNRLHTEESFRKRLKSCLSSFATRKNWRYIGVWERSPERERLHFHGIFYIPEGTVPGEILPFRDYDTRSGKMRVTWQSLYFNERFGRSDFEEIKSKNRIGEALAYLMKYLEKAVKGLFIQRDYRNILSLIFQRKTLYAGLALRIGSSCYMMIFIVMMMVKPWER